MIKINKEFRDLIPPLTADELQGLEESILAEGCREPVILWNDTIVDGHNRHAICTKHKLEFKTIEKEFEDEIDARIWIRNNQMSRRNLPDIDRIALQLGQNKDRLTKEAKEQQKRKPINDSVPPNLAEQKEYHKNETREKIANAAGVSHGNVSRVEKILKAAPDKVDDIRQGKTTINKVYTEIRKEEKKQEFKEKTAKMKETEEIKTDNEITVNIGDWWQLGRHRIYCGDTSKPEFYDKIPQAKFAFADPPYNVDKAEWDNGFIWHHDWLIDKAEVVAVTPGIKELFNFARLTIMPYIWEAMCWISNGRGRGAMGFGNHIPALLFSYGSINKNIQDVFRIDLEGAYDSIHPSKKPEAFMAWMVDTFGEKGIVIDPFLGSGTTLRAADAFDCICYGGDLVPEYCKEVILKWEAKTKQKAVKLNDDME